MRSTFKLLFYVKRNVPKSDNSLPLMGRITINKGIVQFSLKMSVPPELWDSKAGKAMGKSEKYKPAVGTNSGNNKQSLSRNHTSGWRCYSRTSKKCLFGNWYEARHVSQVVRLA